MNSAEFPNLTPRNHRITSPASAHYNCVAWSAGDTEQWWQPGVFWPVTVPPDEFGIHILQEAFASLGYQDCEDEGLETGVEKIALFGDSTFYTHAARQLPNGH